MDPHHPLSAKRLHAWRGDEMIDFPPCFIEKLGKRLEEREAARPRPRSVLVPPRPGNAVLQRVGLPVDLTPTVSTAVPVSTLRALANILDILHTEHRLRQDHPTASAVSEQAVEGLIVCGRELLRSHAAAMWADV